VVGTLTRRERVVVRLLEEGNDHREIAGLLGCCRQRVTLVVAETRGRLTAARRGSGSGPGVFAPGLVI
jgi:DNA-binding NarL/FixJ family response regulator